MRKRILSPVARQQLRRFKTEATSRYTSGGRLKDNSRARAPRPISLSPLRFMGEKRP